MCTILLAWRCLEDARFVLAANRDELVSRPAAPPGPLNLSPPVYGGHDLLAGGTWLAVTPEGRVAAVTNRRAGDEDEASRDPTRRSRGELPLRILREPAPHEAIAGVRPADYNPFNLLSVDTGAALAGHGRRDAEAVEVVQLAPGPHVLCVHDVDDRTHTKELRLQARLREVVALHRTAEACAEAMVAMLRDHTTDDGARDATCIHGDEYGTVSASLVSLDATGHVLYRHAAGRPCITEFADVPLG
jgi:uncharacterized protein with NRDE domain